MGVYFFYGEEDFNIDIEIENMRAKLNPDFISMSYQVLDNPEYSDLISTLRKAPMMFGNILSIIHCEKYFTTQGISFEDSELNDIDDALKNNQESSDIVFVLKIPRDEKKKPDTRRKIYKIISKYNLREFPAIKKYKTAEISAWLHKRAKTKKLTLTDDAVYLLIEQLGNNLRQLDTELDKLKLIAYPENKITKEMVCEISISNQELFNITDSILKKRKDQALSEYQKLTDKKHPLEILAGIQTILRNWIFIKLNYGKTNIADIVKVTGMNEYAIKPLAPKLKSINIADIVMLKENLFKAEYNIKSGKSIDIEKEVEYAIIK